ncbi:MAG: DUF4037 domain-containing protein [Desulfosarcinaceae bacterium]
MKGLDLAEAYYRQHGQPMIAELFPAFSDRIAAGLVGPGSECFGFDDQWSRDHDWGPGFCLWLTDEDYVSIGGALQAAYEGLPDRFMGFGPRLSSPGEEWRVGVSATGDFFTRLTGLDHPPECNADWLRIPEHALATCVNGQVFADSLGEFIRRRRTIDAYYPEDVRLMKIASRCITIAQSGQYNYPRALQRGDRFAAEYARTQFCTDMISLVFLLNRRFTPFYKWLLLAVAELPLLGTAVHLQINAILATADARQQAHLMAYMTDQAIQAIKDQGLSDVSSDFLLDHVPAIHAKIDDARLKQRLTVLP